MIDILVVIKFPDSKERLRYKKGKKLSWFFVSGKFRNFLEPKEKHQVHLIVNIAEF